MRRIHIFPFMLLLVLSFALLAGCSLIQTESPAPTPDAVDPAPGPGDSTTPGTDETPDTPSHAHVYDEENGALVIAEDGSSAAIRTLCTCGDAKNTPYCGTYVRGNDAFEFDRDGKRISRADGVMEYDGKTYYVIHDEVQCNAYIRVENSIYYYGEDGAKRDETLSEREVTAGGKTYYVINNEIQSDVYIRIENNIYYYGEDGAKSADALTEREITLDGKTYYVIDNEVQSNAYIRIENNIYYYGEDGAKSADALTEREITLDGVTYYVVGNAIQKDAYIRIENNIYYYGEDGAKSEEALDEREVTAGGKTYYVINNEIQSNVYIRIENNVYYYGNDGAKSTAPIDRCEVTLGDKTYYIIQNEISHNIYARVDNKIYYYGADGAKSNAVLDCQEVVADGKTYYVVNNEIRFNVYIRIENNIYYYGTDGAKSNTPLSEREVTAGGKTYYVINNKIQSNVYIRIENNIYYYGADGAKSDAPLNEREVSAGGKTYYVINNKIQSNVYIRIENNIYYYGTDGAKSDAPLNEQKITAGGETYYVVNNRIQINLYIVIENRIYYFGTTGAMLKNDTHDGFRFNENGMLTGSGLYIEISDQLYEVQNNVAAPHTHQYEDETTLPTCTAKGYTTYTCACGDDYVDDYENALGHDYGTLIERVAPTCRKAGCAAYYQCSRCKALFDETYTATDMKSLTLDAVYHNFVNDRCEYCSLQRTTTSGRVFLANEKGEATTPIKDATVRVSGTDDKGLPFLLTVKTADNGAFSIADIPYGTYTLTVEKTGYCDNEATIRVFYVNQVQENLFLVPMESEKTGSVSGHAINAQNAAYIAGITIYVRAGTNVTTGDYLMKLYTGSTGAYEVSGLVEGNYTLQFVDEREGASPRFVRNTLNVAILNGKQLSNRDVTLTAAVSQGAMRVVLTWGKTPSDLDSHMLFGSSHVYYSNKKSGYVSLDVDDTSSYGPETITIAQIQEGYLYKYYVYNFSGGSNTQLSSSGACVTIYMGDELLYSVPVPEGSGRYWNVFTYSAEDGFTIYNTVSGSHL